MREDCDWSLGKIDNYRGPVGDAGESVPSLFAVGGYGVIQQFSVEWQWDVETMWFCDRIINDSAEARLVLSWWD